jgi:hypothetical protein
MTKIANALKWIAATAAAVTPAVAMAQSFPDAHPIQSTSVTQVISSIINYVGGIAGAIAVLMIVWGGIQYMAFGADQGKKTITNGLTGLAIIILAYVLVKVVTNLLGA